MFLVVPVSSFWITRSRSGIVKVVSPDAVLNFEFENIVSSRETQKERKWDHFLGKLEFFYFFNRYKASRKIRCNYSWSARNSLSDTPGKHQDFPPTHLPSVHRASSMLIDNLIPITLKCYNSIFVIFNTHTHTRTHAFLVSHSVNKEK